MSQQTSPNTPAGNFTNAQSFANYVRQTLQAAGTSAGITQVNLNTQGSTPMIVAQTNAGKVWNLRVEEGGSNH